MVHLIASGVVMQKGNGINVSLAAAGREGKGPAVAKGYGGSKKPFMP